MARVVLERAIALFEMGRRAEADQAFARASALDPSVTLTEATVRPDVARAFQAARVLPAPAPSPPRTPDPEVAALEALGVAPSVEGARALLELLGIGGALTVAITVDGGALTLVGRQHGPGCATAIQVEVVDGAGLVTAARSLVDRLAREPCAEVVDGGEAPAPLLGAREIAAPRPASRPSGAAAVGVRRLRLWERPWLWAGLVAAAAVAVVATAATVSSDPTYSARIDGRAFSSHP
jgi:hypothetical protein